MAIMKWACSNWGRHGCDIAYENSFRAVYYLLATTKSSAMPITDVTFRTATPADAQRIHELHLAAVRALCCKHYSPEILDGWLANRSAQGYLHGISTRTVIVAEMGSLVVGFSEWAPGEIVAVFVDPSFTSLGIGFSLLEHAFRLAQMGANTVRLEATLNAIPFYERFGFRQVEHSTVRRNHIEVPIVVMHLPANTTPLGLDAQR